MLIVPCMSWPTGISFSGRKMEIPFISFNVSFIIVLPYIIYQNKNDASNNPKNIASYYLFLLQIKKAREEQLYDSDVIRACAKETKP
jgi:hypothetical protein